MNKKPRIIISERKKTTSSNRVFVITIGVETGQFLFMKTYASGVRFFNENGYFIRFLNNFKEGDQRCYLLCSLSYSYSDSKFKPSVVDETLEDTIKKALFLSSGREISSSGSREHHYLLTIQHNEIGKIQQIMKLLFMSDSEFYFVFGDEPKQNMLADAFRDFKKREERIITSHQEALRLSMGCCSAEEEFVIFTERFNMDEIKDKISASIDSDKVEVVAK